VLPVNWKNQAQDDLAEIIDYIEQRNASAAQNLHQTIVQTGH
jgi:plasmid stabilization system protein ParE